MKDKVLKKLAKKKLKVSLFESASAGYLACKISQSPYSGLVLDGSLVCYDLSVKRQILNIPETLIKKYTAESEEVTIELIRQGQKLFDSDIYIACTGLLKRGGSETKEKPVGTFFFAIQVQGKIYSYRTRFKGKPQQKLKLLYCAVMKRLNQILKQHAPKLKIQ